MRFILGATIALTLTGVSLPNADAAVTLAPVLRYDAASVVVSACRPDDQSTLASYLLAVRAKPRPSAYEARRVVYFVAAPIVVTGQRTKANQALSRSIPASAPRHRARLVCCR